MRKSQLPLIAFLAATVSWTSAPAQESVEPLIDSAHVSGDSLNTHDNPVGQPFRMGDGPAEAVPIPLGRSLKSESFFTSPTGTLLKSVAFPGWGQWSNGKKQKAAFYFGIESYWIAKSLVWRHRARKADNLSEFAHARDRRNYFYWLTGITIFVSMFDAYADRYLLTLERTRDMPDEFWGERMDYKLDDGWQFSLAVKF